MSFTSPLRRLLAGFCLAGMVAGLCAQVHEMDSPAPGLQEAGVPQFNVLNKESLGLDSPPTDLHLLPDGRVLVVAGPQLAFGDGIRWEVFVQAGTEAPSRALSVAVDADGTIYQAVEGGFARVAFDQDGKWRLVRVADRPGESGSDGPVPREVIDTGGQWLWHNNSGPIVAWQPGQQARVVGRADAVTHIFRFQDGYYLCDWSIGDVRRISGADPRAEQAVLTNVFLTCSQPLADGRMLVGTGRLGLQVFDGHTLQPPARVDPLAGNLRVNSLAVVKGGYFAAAVENRGVVFLDGEGHTVQLLDRVLDHRLSRVIQLVAAPNGIVWGRLADGILRVEFPSRVSHFEPLIHSGLVTLHPSRAEGRLWLLASDQLLTATYEPGGRLDGFVADNPSNEKIFGVSCVLGAPVAGTERGGYIREPGGWRLIAPDARGFRLLQDHAIDGEWLFGADQVIGWARRTDDGLTVRRYPAPGLGRVYNAVTDRHGDVWTELGTGSIGRIRPGRPGSAPQVDLLGAAQGVPDGWAQVFVMDGVIRFNVADRIYAFDAAAGRLVPDTEFARAFASLGTIVGRPGRDFAGRIWITNEQGVHLYTGDLAHLEPVDEPMPAGFQPYYFTFERGGAVWMHSMRRLARYDPAIARPAPSPAGALITHVTLPASGRTLFPEHGALPRLPYADNTLIAHFLSTGTPFTTGATFEVNLDGTAQGWVSAGSGGSAVFNQLKEGRYTLQVRPRSAGVAGAATNLAIVIEPPWYRTTGAYIASSFFVVLGGILIVRLVVYLQRREQRRLENLVRQRTSELKEANVRLATQVEENRTLSLAIQQSPVGVLLLKPDGTIIFANPRMCESSGYTLADLMGRPVRLLRGAPADGPDAFEQAVARGEAWHGQMTNRTRDGRDFHVRVTASPLRSQQGATTLFLVLEEDITESLAEQERRHRLEAQLFQAQKRESLGTLAGGIAHDFNNILTGILGYCELARLTLGEGSAVDQELAAITAAGRRAKDLVSQILSFTRQTSTQLAILNLADPVAEALKLVRASIPASIEIVSSLARGQVRADASQIHQVMLNLCTNAAHAMRSRPAGRLEVTLERVTLDAAQAAEHGGVPPGDYMRLRVADNGAGMPPAVLDRIFDPFFTTKEPGEGTGLGLSIVQGIVTGHRGGLRVRSAAGAGTAFDLVFPLSQEARPDSTPPMPVPAGGQQQILVVDDEAMVTDFIAARLRQLGYRPQVEHDPREALAKLLAEPARFAALITDLSMPHMSGVELINQLRRSQLDLPTLIITGYNRNSARADLASVPDIPLLQKPFTGDELAQALHKVIEGHRATRGPFPA